MSTSTKLLTAGGFLSFFVFGFIDNLKGPLLPQLLRSEGLSYSQGGTVFLSAYLGFIVATLIGGLLADQIGNRRLLWLAGLGLSGGICGLNLSDAYGLLTFNMFLIGMGLGAIEVGANGLMVDLHSAARARYLNLLGTCHGVGSLLVPLYAAWQITNHVAWQRIYLQVIILTGLLTVIFLLPSKKANAAALVVRKSREDWKAVFRAGFTPRMGWYYLLIGNYVAVELGLAAWLVEYLQQVRQFTVPQSTLYLSAFFVLLMLGRLLGSMVVEYCGYMRMIVGGLMGAMLCIAGGLVSDSSNTAWLFPLSGLFMSIVFPTVTAAVSGYHKENLGSIFGILFTFGGVGGALGPWTVGLVSDRLTLPVGLASLLGFGLISLLAVWRAGRGE